MPPTESTPSQFPHVPNNLEWHQLVAIAVCLTLFFSKTSQKQPGVLLADDVGVGKTLEVFGTIAAITDLVDRCDKDHMTTLPSILGKSRT